MSNMIECSNNIEYKFNHFIITFMKTPAGEFKIDYKTGKFTPVSYKNTWCPMVCGEPPLFNEKTQVLMERYFHNRAIPKERPFIKEILESIGLKYWNAWDQFYVTHGRHDGDPQKVYFVGEDISIAELKVIREKYCRNSRINKLINIG